MPGITRTTSIEDLVALFPEAVRVLVRHNLPCLVCGEPVWGTFEEVARGSGKDEAEIDALVLELNALRAQRRSTP